MAHKTEEKAKNEKQEKTQEIVGTRGRTFEGTVTKKFPTRVVIEFERTVFIQKYERYARKKTRLHARLPQGMDINVGDYIKVRECRPLSKIIHFVVIEKIRSASDKQEKKEQKHGKKEAKK
jgi:small subunit ribosomal protein S17